MGHPLTKLFVFGALAWLVLLIGITMPTTGRAVGFPEVNGGRPAVACSGRVIESAPGTAMFQVNPDVLVAGAGPVGERLPAWLSRGAGSKVKIADAGWQPGMHSYGLALHPAALRLVR